MPSVFGFHSAVKPLFMILTLDPYWGSIGESTTLSFVTTTTTSTPAAPAPAPAVPAPAPTPAGTDPCVTTSGACSWLISLDSCSASDSACMCSVFTSASASEISACVSCEQSVNATFAQEISQAGQECASSAPAAT